MEVKNCENRSGSFVMAFGGWNFRLGASQMALKELGVAKEHRSTMKPDLLQVDRPNVMSRANPEKSMSPCNISAGRRGVKKSRLSSRQAIIDP